MRRMLQGGQSTPPSVPSPEGPARSCAMLTGNMFCPCVFSIYIFD